MKENVSTGSSPRRIRHINVVSALQNLYAAGRMSRAELARRLGLNRSSSGQIVAEMTDSGLVREVDGFEEDREQATRGAGRPGIMLELVPEAAFFTGIEVGVEHISALTIDLAGERRTHARLQFDASSAPVEMAVSQAVDMAFKAMTPEMTTRCKGVGISAPMHIRPDGVVRLAPRIGWRDVALTQIVEAAIPAGVPVMIENDANAFAIGDGYKHSQAGVTLFLLMESGVGGGILFDGKLFRGGHGLAGEIGHLLVPGTGGVSLEQAAGRDALISRYRAGSGRLEAEFPEFLDAVRDREPTAVAIAEDWARNLAFTLSQASRLIDPERIVLGGSVAALYPLVAARVAVHLSSRQEVSFPSTQQAVTFPAPQIVVDEDAEFGSAFGAACMLHQRFLSFDNEDLFGDSHSPARLATPTDSRRRTPESVI